jgi:SPP1 gp7 family putative phage head morphogenesis protein
VPPTKKPPKSFHATRTLERAYAQGISGIVRRILVPRGAGQSLQDWLQELASRSQSEEVAAASEFLAARMVAWTNKRNYDTWRQAAARSQRSAKLFALMRRELQGPVGATLARLRAENARYIRSVAPEAAAHLVKEITELELKGARSETVAKMAAARFPKLLRSRVRLIARTEAQKTSAALTRARAENVGAQWYEWLTSDDARVRDSHRKMAGVLVRYDDPPSPEALVGEPPSLGKYNSGEAPNCRCSQAPMLHVDDVSWPHRVYRNGSIRSLNKQQFLALNRINTAANAA